MLKKIIAYEMYKELLLENKPFSKTAKRREKGYLYDAIFLNCGHWNQNENYQKTSRI